MPLLTLHRFGGERLVIVPGINVLRYPGTAIGKAGEDETSFQPKEYFLFSRPVNSTRKNEISRTPTIRQ